jgi:hypothetical protein
MKIPNPISRLLRLLRLSIRLSSLPRAHLCFRLHLDPEQVQAAYRQFTKPHPKYKLFKNKSMGVALIDLARYADPAAYLDAIGGPGYAGPRRHTARSLGYQFRSIDCSEYTADIQAIDAAASSGHGATSLLAASICCPYCRCYGAFNRDGKLVAYCTVCVYGNFAATDQLSAYRNRDGVMYLVLTEIICELLREGQIDYFMFDTFLGAKTGQREFKRRFGFEPYRARFALT